MGNLTISRNLLALMLAALTAAGPRISHAQEDVPTTVQTIVIENNQIRINGQVVDDQHVPDDLRLDGIDLSYSFIGVDTPVVTIGGNLYAVRENRLEPLPSDLSRQNMAAAQKNRERNKLAEDARGYIVDTEKGAYYTFQGRQLAPGEAVPRLLNDANTLYLQELKVRDQVLFERLVRERDLEVSANRLAHEIRLMPPGEEREERTQELREKLAQIFDLKQENRRHEIEQFERRLEHLRVRLQEREAKKLELLEQRLDKLTHP